LLLFVSFVGLAASPSSRWPSLAFRYLLAI
jgi:hypothetical protein